MNEPSEMFPSMSINEMSIEDYFQLENSSLETRYEYIDGQVRMLAGGTLNHGTIRSNLTRILGNLLDDRPCQVFSEDRVRISASKYVYPDVTVSCSQQDRGNAKTIKHPLLVIEVLSPSTADYDRGQKFVLYRNCPTIREYMLVNTQYSGIDLYRRESEHLWSLHIYQYEDTVELTSLNVRFPVTAIYKNVIFPPREDDEPT